MASLTWGGCTPYVEGEGYNVFKSTYRNLRYRIKNSQPYRVSVDDMSNLPGIAFKAYGTTDLWRVILEFNGLSDPLNDVFPGQILNIPQKSDILVILSEPISNTTQVTI